MGGKVWSRAEDAMLVEMWPVAAKEKIIAAFPNRRIGAIERRAGLLRLQRRRVRRAPKIPVLNELWKLREHKRILRRDLCDRMGYHPVMFGRWERGDATPSLRRLVDWCDALGVELTIRTKRPRNYSSNAARAA